MKNIKMTVDRFLEGWNGTDLTNWVVMVEVIENEHNTILCIYFDFLMAGELKELIRRAKRSKLTHFVNSRAKEHSSFVVFNVAFEKKINL